jgi:hypothetical protein
MASLEARLGALKYAFEATIASSPDPRPATQQAQAWRSMGLSLVAAVSAMEPERYGSYYEEKEAETERVWKDKNASWDRRAIFAMRMCDEALSKLIVILADKKNNKNVLLEFQDVMARHGVDSGKARTEPARLAETKVYWSNRLVALFPLVLKLMAFDEGTKREDILEDLVNRAEIIASRRDIHYQARMDLLYLNNVQSLTSMFFFLATLPQSSIREVAAGMEETWEKSLKDPDLMVSNKIALSLVAAAQLSFHLSFWYAGGK